jgi:hypothetical protein
MPILNQEAAGSFTHYQRIISEGCSIDVYYNLVKAVSLKDNILVYCQYNLELVKYT